MISSLSDYVNTEVLRIWEHSDFVKPQDYIPCLCKKIDRNPLLFIGLNPSFSEKHLQAVCKTLDLAGLKHIHMWENRCEENYQRAKDLIEQAAKHSSFHSRFQKMSNALFGKETMWTYIDLFFWRETKQADFEKRLGYKRGKPVKWVDFWKKQLELSFRLVKEINPKIILVQNALIASLFMQEQELRHELGIDLSSDSYDSPDTDPFFNQYGYHHLTMNGRRIPIFFSGMLYAQRALDNFSFDRLVWQMKRALGSVGRDISQGTSASE